jgi:protein-S-isoprenylcysteine O-methyltransferase Ste14
VFFLVADPTPSALLVGFLLGCFGLMIRGVAAGTILKDQVLTTGGIYGNLRHPLYMGSLLLGGGLAVASGRWWMVPLFLVGFVILYGATIRREEAHLCQLFGERHEEYRRAVPALLPRFSRPDGAGEGQGFRASTYRRNNEWEAALGSVIGFGLLWLKMTLWG